MKNLINSKIAKFAACILLSFFGAIAIVTGYINLKMYGRYGKVGVEAGGLLKKEELTSISQNVTREMIDEYYVKIAKGNSKVLEEFKERFSNDNCNLAVSITPSEDDLSLPKVSNYAPGHYQEKVKYDYSLYLGFDTKLFTYKIDKSKLNELLRDIEDDPDPYYYYEKFYAQNSMPYFQDTTIENGRMSGYFTTAEYFFPEDYVMSNGVHSFVIDEERYYLDLDEKFYSEYNEFFKDLEDKNGEWNYVEYYDNTTSSYIVRVEVPKISNVVLEGYLQTNYTANDEFSRSFILNNAYSLSKNIIWICLVSLILSIILLGFLLMSAGHVAGSDEIKQGSLEIIPSDVLVLVLFIVLITLAENLQSASDVYIVFAFGVIALLGPIVLLTTATRIKGRQLFKNTLCYKAIDLLFVNQKRNGGFIVRAVKKVASAVGYLLSKANLYAKYVGIYGVLGILEMLIIVSISGADGGDAGIVFFCLLVEKALGTALIIATCINLDRIKKAGNELAEGNIDYVIDTSKLIGEFKAQAENLNKIRDGIAAAVEKSIKSERMKTELITNVSHDIKTPLTSIISYVDLLEKEELDNEQAREYIAVLDRQSAKLKKLIADLIEASKASTGNMEVHLEKTNVPMLVEQSIVEFSDKLEAINVNTVVNCDHSELYAVADGRLLWRVFENIVGNIVKYAQPSSRAYFDIVRADKYVEVTAKNISKDALNISGDELMERFVRGDGSRNTEGSGLGLSIAKSLVEIQNGTMEIIIDGDLFKVKIKLNADH